MTSNEYVALHEHLDDQFRDYREAHRREHELMNDALVLARHLMAAKTDEMNNVRTQILSERAMLATKDSVSATVGPMLLRIDALEASRDRQQGMIEQQAATTRNWIAGLVILLAGLEFLLRYVIQ